MDSTQKPPATSQTSWVALGVLLLVVLAVGAGAFYLKGMLPATEQDADTVQALETQSDSTAPEEIEADLSAESPDEFDQEFDAAFAELEASLAE